MVAAITGFLGSIIGLIVTAIAAAAGLTFFVIAWKAGALPDMFAWVTGLIGWGRDMTIGFFTFLRDLINFAQS